jgi:hypothetical protein
MKGKTLHSVRLSAMGWRNLAGILLALCASLQPAAAHEVLERLTVTSQVQQLMAADDYAGLETLADTYRASGARTTSGVSKLTLFHAGVSEGFDRSSQGFPIWEERSDWMKEWLRRHPASTTAKLAAGILLSNRGWAMRGTDGYAHMIEDERREPYANQTRATGAYLDSIHSVAAQDPHWYVLTLTIAMQLSADDADVMALFDEGTERYPEYLEIYFAGVRNFLPQWNGSAEALDAFVQHALTKVPRKDRPALYARMYWTAAQSHEGSLFEWSKADWSKMRRGFDDVLKQYPSEWNLQASAFFACAAGDHAGARKRMARMQDPDYAPIWEARATYERCYALAFPENPVAPHAR